MHIISPAKLNLFLNITGRREDGYHLLESLFVPLKLHDEIFIELSKSENILEVDGAEIENNIIYKLLDFLLQELSIEQKFKIYIKKNIPLGSGLGGSSTNFASILKAINSMIGMGLSYSQMHEICMKFGSDIAYFLDPKISLIKGVGEVIEPAKFLKSHILYVLILYPGVESSSQDCYKLGEFEYADSLNGVYLDDLIYNGTNALQNNAINLNPKILEFIQILELQKGSISTKLTGSGSCVFSLFKTEEDLNLAYQNLQQFHVYKEIIAL